MPDELVQELRRGRVSGPFQPPSWWCGSAIPRAGHNSAIVAGDVPHHHTLSTFIALARSYADRGEPNLLWAQDLQGAYRQFPVARPDECFAR